MTEVISVRFKDKGKIYFFDANNVMARAGENVIVETAKGLEYGECAKGNHMVADERLVPPLRPVIRVATEEDKKTAEENKVKEKRAFDTCQQKIAEHGLDMKLVDVEYNFEGSKVLFFFTSDGRVDFRELVKDLASLLHARIELRQIGVRDEAKMLGGLGICGRPFCCNQFLDDFQPVSIKMAKTQSLSLNPTKISGTCGRLMCCLKYEQDAYEDLLKTVPQMDAYVETPDGRGTVVEVNVLRQKVKVKFDNGQLAPDVKVFSAEEIETLKSGKAHRAELAEAKAKAEEAARNGEVLPESAVPEQPEKKSEPKPRPRQKPKTKPAADKQVAAEKKPAHQSQSREDHSDEQKPKSNRRRRPRRKPQAKPQAEAKVQE